MSIDFNSPVMRLQYIEDAVLKGIVKIGGKPVKGDRGWRTVSLFGQSIEYSCGEKHRHIRQILTDKEMRWRMPGSKNWKQVLEPTGVLTFAITSYTPDRFQKSWRDTDKHRLEDCISDIIAAFPKVAQSMNEHHRRLEEESERRRLIAVKSAEERTRRARENNRWERFVRIAEERKDILVVEEYLATLKARTTAPDTMIGEKSVGDWIVWAEAKVVEWKSRRESPEAVFEIIDWVSADVST